MGDRCYCIFEGGGARGIAHVGALAALEKANLELVGFAGTSAGAIIAALAAAGYSSDELVSAQGTVLSRIDLDRSNIAAGPARRPASRPSHLFGRTGWLYLTLMRTIPPYWMRIMPYYWPHCALLALLYILHLCWTGLAASVGIFLMISAVAAWLAYLLVRKLCSGLAQLDDFERGLNQLLRLKLAERSKGIEASEARKNVPITFRDMQKMQCHPLRVVAADVTSQQMVLFSAATTPDISVASAVAASVCLPVIFKPRRIAQALHLDGGLVSNLPAWTFDAERGVDRDAWTAVVQVGKREKAKYIDGIGIVQAAIATGIFGSGELNVRNVDRLRTASLSVELGLLDFQPGLELANAIIQKARDGCEEKLVFQLCRIPEIMRRVCENIHTEASRLLHIAMGIDENSPTRPVVRVSCFLPPRGDKMSLVAEFQHGFDHAPDERIRLPLKGSFIGQAYRRHVPAFIDRRDPRWVAFLAKDEHRWLSKTISPSVCCVFAIPFLNPDKGNNLVVSVDSDHHIELDQDSIVVLTQALNEAVQRILAGTLPKEVLVDGST